MGRCGGAGVVVGVGVGVTVCLFVFLSFFFFFNRFVSEDFLRVDLDSCGLGIYLFMYWVQ